MLRLVMLTKLFLLDMLTRNEGRILQLASMVSKMPAPWSAVYGDTKAFVYSFTLARDGQEAMMAGRNSVVSGWRDKAANLLPDQPAAKQMGKMQRPKAH